MRRRVRLLLIVLACQAVGATAAVAATPAVCEAPPPTRSPWAVAWQGEPGPAVGMAVLPGLSAEPLPSASTASANEVQAAQPAPPTQPRPMAFEYSDAYNTRRKIHFYASFATLPLFVSEYIVGQQLYDGTGGSGTKGTHTALAAGTAVLFGVNSVTGVWNLMESRKDPNHRTKRMVHGILMLAADAGFVATAALAPESEEGELSGNRSTHRSVAITSMAIATASYLVMLFGR